MSASNLRLLIEAEDLEFSDHILVVKGVQDILDDVEIEITGARTARAHWTLVNEPSVFLTANPNGVAQETLENIASTTWETFRIAREKVLQGENLSTLEMSHRRREALVKIMNLVGHELERVTVDIEGREPLIFDRSPETQPAAAPELRYEEIATFDGVVDLWSLRHRPFFALRETNSQRIIKVFYQRNELEAIRPAAGRTAEVTGLTRFREDGSPISIRNIDSIFVYPDAEVGINQYAGSIPDLLGDLSLDEYLDQIRGVNDR